MPPLRAALLCLLLCGCPASGWDPEPQVSLVDEAPTVVRVSWSTDSAVLGQVRFGESVDYDLVTPLDDTPGTEHSALLVGVPANTELHFALVAHDDGGELQGSDHSIVTGGVPASLPAVTVEQGERSPARFTAIPVVADLPEDEPQVVAVLDDRARWVWATQLPLGYKSLRVRLAPDGGGVVYNAVAIDKESDLEPRMIQVDWSGETVLDLDAPALHHDFVLLPDGGLAFLATEPAQVGEFMMGSDVIMELDSSGNLTEAWALWDHIEEEFGMVIEPDNLDPSSTLGHANAMQLLDDGAAWLVNFANLGAVARIERDTGDVSWILGSIGDSFPASPEPLPEFRAHEVLLEDDALWLFVNDVQDDECSRLWMVSLDHESQQATLLDSYHWDPCQYTYALGGLNRLDAEHTLMVWSIAGRLEVLDGDLAPVWAAQASLGAGFGYTSSVDTLY